MGLYSSGQLPDTTSGIPNVSQFGWTPLEYDKVQQIIDYVDEVKGYRDEVIKLMEEGKVIVEYVNNTLVEFNNKVTEINKLYENILNMYNAILEREANVLKYHDAVKGMLDQIILIYEDFVKKYLDLVKRHGDIIERHDDIVNLNDQARSSAADSESSAVKSQQYYEESFKLYEELRKGQVYRGTWNPHTGNYPDPKGTNSTWDVILNAGEIEFKFDDKLWYWGDRLNYVKEENIYVQIEAGTNVKSVNGKTGAVSITLEELGGVKKAGDTMTGDLTSTGFIVSKNTYPGIRLTATSNDAPFRNKYIEVSTGGALSFITRDSSFNNNGVVTLAAGKNGEIYHTGNKPTPGEIGAYTSTEVDNKIDSKISNYSYSKAEMNSKLSAKSDKTYTDSMLAQKVDKLTTVNGKPLSSNVTLNAGDVNAVSKTGDTMTGTLNLPNIKVTGDGVGITNRLNNNLIREGGNGIHTVVGNDSGNLYLDTKDGDANVRAGSAVYRIYHTGNKPTAADVGAADVSSNSTDIHVLSGSNSSRTKKVTMYSKEGRLYAMAEDGTISQFYNDKSYKPTVADFGGLGVENGNELNIPSNKSDFHFGYRKNGTEISTYHFANGKSQLGQYADIKAKEFYAQGNKRVYHEGFKPTAKDVGALPITGGTLTGTFELFQSGYGVRFTGANTRGYIQAGHNTDTSDQKMWITGWGSTDLTELALKMKHGVNPVVRWDNNVHKIYHEGFKPTASDVEGVVKKSGDTMTGVLNVPRVEISANDAGLTNNQGKNIIRSGGSNVHTIVGNTDGNVYLDTKGGLASVRVGSTEYRLYHEGFKPDVSALDVVKKSGDTMTGNLAIDTGSTSKLLLGSGSTTGLTRSGDNLFVSAYSGSGKVVLEGQSHPQAKVGSTTYDLYHTGKRPSPADIGAVNKASDTMTGPLSINYTHGQLRLIESDKNDKRWDVEVNDQEMRFVESGVGTRLRLQPSTGNIVSGGEFKTTGSNSYRFTGGPIGTFWRKDGANLYLMRTEEGQSESGTWSSHRPMSMELSSGNVSFGHKVFVKEMLTVNGPVVMTGMLSNNAISHTNKQLMNATESQVYIGNRDGIAAMSLQTNSGVVNVTHGQTNHRVYHQGYKPSAADVQALSLNGGTVNGHVRVNDTILPNIQIPVNARDVKNSGLYVCDTLSAPAGSDYDQYSSVLGVAAGNVVSRHFQMMVGNDGKSFKVRASHDNAPTDTKFYPWYRVYTEGFKPTANDVGALPTTGGTVKGNVTVEGQVTARSSSGFQTAKSSEGVAVGLSSESGYVMMWRRNNDEKKADEFIAIDGSSKIRFRKDNGTGDRKYTDHHIYHSGYKPTASDVGALPITGGTATDHIWVDKGPDAGPQMGVKRGIRSTHLFDNGAESGIYMYQDGTANDTTLISRNHSSGTVFLGGGKTVASIGPFVAQNDIGFDMTSGRRHLKFNTDGSPIHIFADKSVRNFQADAGFKITGGGASGVGVQCDFEPVGEPQAGFRTRAQPGAWTEWRSAAPALQVDCSNPSGAAYEIWRATQWGAQHIAAMQVHVPSGDFNNSVITMSLGNSSTQYMFNANGTAVAAGGWSTGSDRNFKENIVYSDSPKNKMSDSFLDKVCQLRTANFKYKAGGDTRLGFIAQDVQPIIPEAVTEIVDTTKSEDERAGTERLYLDSMAIIAAQNEAIKELRQMVLELQEKLK